MTSDPLARIDRDRKRLGLRLAKAGSHPVHPVVAEYCTSGNVYSPCPSLCTVMRWPVAVLMRVTTLFGMGAPELSRT